MPHRSFPTFPVLTILIILGPVVAGLAGAIGPAFGYLPSAGLEQFSFDQFQKLFDWPGIWRAMRLSVVTGLATTTIALTVTVAIFARWSGTKTFRAIQSLLSPLLSVPHAAAAFGIAFLISPSGWFVRLFSPWLTGWDRPPDLLILNDPNGIAIIAGLAAKEVPFLFLMALAALGQVQNRQSISVAQALGYERGMGWIRAVLPRIYSQIRLPVYVVLAYSMSVVDVAVILGPNTPAPLSVKIVEWMSEPDLQMRAQAAAASLLQFGLVAAVIAGWRLMEIAIGWGAARRTYAGQRSGITRPLAVVGLIAGGTTAAALLLGIVILVMWSFAGYWGFPSALPDSLSLATWGRHGGGALDALGSTVGIALVATLIALALTIGCLETEHRQHVRLGRTGIWLLYLPLIVPQTAFLPGLQILMLNLGLSEGVLPVMFAHIVFVLPYVFLSLSDSWRAWDSRYGQAALSLGSSPSGVLFRVRMPMLLAPVLTAIAVGISVSVGQYLPTLIIGGGRVETLTTEALALASGGDRRAIGAFGLLQTMTAMVPFALALAIPAIAWRNRRKMRHE